MGGSFWAPGPPKLTFVESKGCQFLLILSMGQDGVFQKIHPVNLLLRFELNVIHLREAKFEPAVTKCLSDSEIMSILNTPLNIKLPVSSVAVERAVKLTTRCAVLAGSVKEVNGVMQCSILSQKSNY